MFVFICVCIVYVFDCTKCENILLRNNSTKKKKKKTIYNEHDSQIYLHKLNLDELICQFLRLEKLMMTIFSSNHNLHFFCIGSF